MTHSWKAFDKAKEIVDFLKEYYLKNLSKFDEDNIRGSVQIILEE